MKDNPYYFIFYNLFKFSKTVATKDSTEKDFAYSAFLGLTISFFSTLISADILLGNHFSKLIGLNYDYILWISILFLLYSTNKFLLIRNQKYLEIVTHYEQKKITNSSSIIISLTFLILCYLSFFLIIALKKQVLNTKTNTYQSAANTGFGAMSNQVRRGEIVFLAPATE